MLAAAAAPLQAWNEVARSAWTPSATFDVVSRLSTPARYTLKPHENAFLQSLDIFKVLFLCVGGGGGVAHRPVGTSGPRQGHLNATKEPCAGQPSYPSLGTWSRAHQIELSFETWARSTDRRRVPPCTPKVTLTPPFSSLYEAMRTSPPSSVKTSMTDGNLSCIQPPISWAGFSSPSTENEGRLHHAKKHA